MEFSAVFVSDDFIQNDILGGFEQVLFDLRIHVLQLLDELLGFVSSRSSTAIVADGTVLRESACTLDETELVHVSPGDDILLSDIVERSDDFHSFIVVGMELRKHGLEGTGIEKIHQYGFDDIVIMVS